MFEFKNTVIHLLGYPGVGKYTIAKEMAKLAGFRILDNQLINNPIFTVVGADGVTPLQDRVWDYCTKIRKVVFEALEELAEPDANFIMTNYITSGDEADLKQKVDFFNRRDSAYYPVFLTCDLNVHKKRVVSEDRAHRMKEIDPNGPERHMADDPLWYFDHKNRLEFDISSGTPQSAALDILTRISELQKGPTQ